jgi:(4S)-4-hydroxy-5-phosphonooxypentane-2,3-dione isomerase
MGGGMDGLVILVRFELVPGRRHEFMRYVLENAKASVTLETGCRRFDVLVDELDASDDITLYEIYDDSEAFDRHLQTDHFAAFRTGTEPLVLSSSVQRLLLREHAKKE